MSRQGIFKRVSSLLIAIVILAHQGVAQVGSGEESTLKVTVLDASGAAVIAARVQLNNADQKRETLETDVQGEVIFKRLKPGKYELLVEAGGFETYSSSDLLLQPGDNDLKVPLDVAHVKEEVVISQDQREKQTDMRGDAFTSILTEAQIADLPDDPEQLEATLRRMAGPGGSIRVNGFLGGKLPPKSQIREIRFRLNPYSAENHEGGVMGVDIFTKPGISTWHGSFNLGLRDGVFNARNPFAPARGPESHQRVGLALDGPLWKNRTSLFLSVDGLRSFDSKTISAILPEGSFFDTSISPLRKLNFSTRAEHVLTNTHTLRGEFQRNVSRHYNLGVGDFDLPERAYSMSQGENIIRLSDTGLLTDKLVNEVRFQARWQSVDLQSAIDAPAVIVLDAFNRGGAQVDGSRRSFDFELANNFDFAIKKHSIKAGILLQGGNYHSDESNNINGTFTFANISDFRAGRPLLFTRRSGDPSVAFSQYQFAWYLQDDLRIRKDLSLSFGLRHEVQTNLRDKNNFAPRVGLAWSPFADGKTTFRAGAGIFYDWFGAEVYEQTLRVDGKRQFDIVVRNPNFSNALDFDSGISLPPSRIQYDPNLRMPHVQEFSFGVERQLPERMHLRATYFYERGINLLRGHNINAPRGSLGRFYPDMGNIVQVESSASSSRHELNINMNRSSKRFFLLVNYSLSKAINEADSPLSLPANNFDLRAERGYALWDSRHRLYAIANWNVWKQLRSATIISVNSPTPYNIITGFDDNGDTAINDRPEGIARNTARGAYHWDVSTRLSWSLGFGSRGDQSSRRVNVVDANGSADTLGGLSSPALADKRLRTQIYIQFYNVFNRTNLINFTGVQTSPFFGQATAALPGRRIEIGVKFDF